MLGIAIQGLTFFLSIGTAGAIIDRLSPLAFVETALIALLMAAAV